MRKDSTPRFICAACGGAIAVYERCLVVESGEPVERSWASDTQDEREADRARGTYHRACYCGAAQTSLRR
jgi:hypothetical protein